MNIGCSGYLIHLKLEQLLSLTQSIQWMVHVHWVVVKWMAIRHGDLKSNLRMKEIIWIYCQGHDCSWQLEGLKGTITRTLTMGRTYMQTTWDNFMKSEMARNWGSSSISTVWVEDWLLNVLQASQMLTDLMFNKSMCNRNI